MSHRYAHLLPFGATVRDGQRTNFRIWAPGQQKLYLEVDSRPAQPMQCRADGWFELDVDCDAGECYRYRLADGLAVPDPASRAPTDDVPGYSPVVDPHASPWQTPDWRGRQRMETRRVGQECVRTCRSGWARDH